MSAIAPSAYQIEQAMSAYQRALADFRQLDPAQIDGVDASLETMTLQGATADISSMVERLIRSKLEADMMADAVEEYIGRLGQRRDRWERWSARAKDLATEILEIVGWPTPIRYPEFTISKGDSPPSIKITDVALLPDEFCKVTRSPKLTEIRRAIEAGRDVPGAELGNPHTYLKVLRR